MNVESTRIERRTILKMALAAGVLLPGVGMLSSCATGGGAGTSTTSAAATTAATDPMNPFGTKVGSAVDAVIFKGGYGTDYVSFAGTQLATSQLKLAVTVTPQTEIAKTLQPRFVGGNPPDLVDNSGGNQIPILTIVDQVEDLTDVLNSRNLDGDVIKDVIYPGMEKSGQVNGKQAGLNYVLTIYAMWYSQSLFDKLGATVPKTFEDLMTLGAEARSAGKYLFVWGKEASSYYLPFLLDVAIKSAGHGLAVELGNLEPNAWLSQPMVDTAKALQNIVRAGYFKPGGEGTQFTAAQASWSSKQEALLYPCGSWIENEMKDQTASGFQMTAACVPTLTATPGTPYEAIHAEAGESFIVPSKAANVAGGKDLLRAMLSKAAATEFTKTTKSSTIVKGTVPADAYGSTALASQVKLLEGAGPNVFNTTWLMNYGLWSADTNTWFNSFLSGRMEPMDLLKKLQAAADKVAKDPSITKTPVS